MSEFDSSEPTADQHALGIALDAARAGEDKELAQQVRDAGEQFVRLLTGLWRLMRTHDPENDAFGVPVTEFVRVVKQLYDLLGPIQVVCVEGQVYLNDVRIRMDERVGRAADLEQELRKHSCGGLRFEVPISEVQVRSMLHVLAAHPEVEHPLRALQHNLREAGLDSIGVNGLFRLRVSGEEHAPGRSTVAARVELHETLGRAAGLVADAWDNLAAGRTPNPLPLRRMVNEIIDGAASAEEVLADEDALDTEVGRADAAYARHSLRVCTLSVLIGAEMGLSPAALSDLGVAAMFHDVGYSSREGGFAPPFERHSSAGGRMLLRQRGFHAAKIKRILATLQHHDDASKGPILQARIIHVADDFDTLTRRRTGGALHSPADALELMNGSAGRRYDPGVLQLLVNRVGKYPPGTLLRLRDGRWVLSISGVRSPDTFAKPLCRLVRMPDGQVLGIGPEVDLALGGAIADVVPSRDADREAWLRRTLPPRTTLPPPLR